MSLVCVTPPATEPLSLHEVRTQLRLDSTNVEPAPASLAAMLASAGAGNVNVGAHRYMCTFVTADGETQGGDPSVAVMVNSTANAKVALTEIPLGGASVIARHVYRTKADADVFYRMTTISDNTSTTFTDNLADSALGVAVPAQNTTGDPELVALLMAARMHVEDYLQRKLIAQQWRFTTNLFPSCGALELPLLPVISIDAITYTDPSGTVLTLDPDVYEFDAYAQPVVLARAFNATWPSVRRSQSAVGILMTVGYGSQPTDVPMPIRHAIKLLVGTLYNDREANVPSLLQGGVYRALLDTYRVRSFA